jgi:DNA-directed RNA polymerase specialized sigma24 family protein
MVARRDERGVDGLGRDATDPARWLCEVVQPRLIGSLTLYTGDRLLAAELTQDALVKLLDRWDHVAAMDNPTAWAYRVAINLANSRFRRRRAERRARRRLENHRRTDHHVNTDLAAHLAHSSRVGAADGSSRLQGSFSW